MPQNQATTRPAARTITAHAPLPAGVQRTLLGDTDLRISLCSNRHLTGDVWEALLRSRLLAATAAALLLRELTPDQIRLALKVEKRLEPRNVLYACADGDLDWQRELFTAAGGNRRLLSTWAGTGRVHPDLAYQVHAAAGPGHLIRLMADPRTPTAQVITLMTDHPGEWNQPVYNTWVADILGRHPAAVPLAAVSEHPEIRMIAAESRHLTCPDLQRHVTGLSRGVIDTVATGCLARNPVLHPQVRTELHTAIGPAKTTAAKRTRNDLLTYPALDHQPVSWETEIDPQVQKTLVASLQTTASPHLRASNMIALAGNPHLTGDALDHLTRVIAADDAVRSDEVQATFAATHRRAWATITDRIEKRYVRMNLNRNPADHGRAPATRLEQPAAVAEVAWLASQMNGEPDQVWLTVIHLADGFPGTLTDLAEAARILA
jgi:hypothetical protein